ALLRGREGRRSRGPARRGGGWPPDRAGARAGGWGVALPAARAPLADVGDEPLPVARDGRALAAARRSGDHQGGPRPQGALARHRARGIADGGAPRGRGAALVPAQPLAAGAPTPRTLA